MGRVAVEEAFLNSDTFCRDKGLAGDYGVCHVYSDLHCMD
jgi:hypothetical protein